MDIIKSCKDCKISGENIEACHRIEHICALSTIAEEPISKRRETPSRTKKGRPEPAWALTSKTCEDIPESDTERVWVAPYLTSVTLHGHSHTCEWRVSKAGKDYCLVHPCHH